MNRVACLGAEPGLAVGEWLPVGNEVENIGKFPAADFGPIAAATLLETPVADPDAGLADGKAGPPEANPCGTLVMAQAAKPRIGDGCVGEDQLARSEGTWVCFANPGADAKEGCLKTQRTAIRQGQPAGGVPPLGAEIWVGTVIGGKGQPATGNYLGELNCLALG